MISALVALVALAAQAPAPGSAKPAEAAKPAPIVVRVEAAAKSGPAVEDWAKELRTALAARGHEFRLAAEKETPELVVRLDSIGAGASGGAQMLGGALVLGKATRPFTYSFTNVKADAEKLARNLRSVADQMKATGR